MSTPAPTNASQTDAQTTPITAPVELDVTLQLRIVEHADGSGRSTVEVTNATDNIRAPALLLSLVSAFLVVDGPLARIFAAACESGGVRIPPDTLTRRPADFAARARLAAEIGRACDAVKLTDGEQAQLDALLVALRTRAA